MNTVSIVYGAVYINGLGLASIGAGYMKLSFLFFSEVCSLRGGDARVGLGV